MPVHEKGTDHARNYNNDTCMYAFCKCMYAFCNCILMAAAQKGQFKC